MARERFITYSRNLIIEVLGEDGHEVCKEIDLLPDEEEQYRSYKEILHLLSGQEAEVKAHDIYAVPPVNMDKFMRDKFYMGKGDAVYPKVMEELIEMNSGKYVEIVLTGGIGPLSCDTEFLTPTGWVRMDGYQGQEVAEYNPSTGGVEFRDPQAYHVFPCEEFWHFKTKYGVDMKVSDDHRVLYRSTAGKLEVLTAKEIVQQHQKLAKGFKGKFLTTFKVDRPGVSLTDLEIKLQVAVQADGTFNKKKDSNYCVIRIKKQDKKDRLKSLLDELGLHYRVWNLPSEPGYSRFAFKAPLRQKHYGWAWDCSEHQLEIIASECVLWDGDRKRIFRTTLKEDADFITYCFSATGRRAFVRSDDRSSISTLYEVHGSPNTEVTMQGVPKTEIKRVASEDGKMYCFTTQTSFFVARHNGRVFITGNCGKTYCALYTTAYQLYLLSCMKDAHKTFGKDPSTEILFIFQSINTTLAKELDYKRFKHMIECSPYFMNYFPFKKDLESRLVFPNRIEVVPVSGQETAAIGQDVIGGIIDEVNYMAVTQRSKNSVDGGTYNQAIALYNSISRRRKTRFMSQGKLPGLLCIVSSKRYPGQFTDLKELEAKTDPTIYIYDKRVWDIKPSEFSGERFPVFIGDASRKPRIIEDTDPLKETDPDMVHLIPSEFREDFERDIINALRELDGTSTLARFPFFSNIDSITACMGKVTSFLEEESVDFEHQLLTIDPTRFYKPHLPRFAHVDLAISGDSAGVVIGTVIGFKKVQQGEYHEETLPEIWIDAVLEVVPPKNGEIKFFKIRELLYALKDLGLNMKWATFDSFQSKDSQQILAQRGFVTGIQSMDTTPVPYMISKSALYDGRVNLPKNAKLLNELASLERDPMTGKIDHPANSCFTGDTRIALAEGGSISFEELVENDLEFNCISWNIEKNCEEVKPIVAPRITRYTNELIEVELENGEVVRCTPEHLWLLESGEYKQAQYLGSYDALQE